MLDRRYRRYILRKVIKNMWPVTPRDAWRLYNALRCTVSRGRARFRGQPSFVEIEATTACNLRCRFCLNPALPNPRDRITYEQLVHILDAMPGLVAVSLLGLGEPTLNNDLFRMATELRRRKIYAQTVTNLNIPEKMVHELAGSDFNEVNVSLESVDPERYAWFRSGGDLARLEANLALLGGLIRENGRDVTVGLWTTLTEETIPTIDRIFEWCRNGGVVERILFQFVSSKPMHLSVYEDKMKDQLIRDWLPADRKLRDLIWDYSDRYGIMGTLVQPRCGWPWSGFFINAQGLLSPCCFIKDFRNPLWGNIATDSLSTIWHSENWMDLREGLLKGDPHGACKGCPYAYGEDLTHGTPPDQGARHD